MSPVPFPASAETDQTQPNAFERLHAHYDDMQPIPQDPDHRMHECQDGSRVLIGAYRPHRASKQLSFLTECFVVTPNGKETGFLVDNEGKLHKLWLPRQKITIGNLAVISIANHSDGIEGNFPSFNDSGIEAADKLVSWADTFFQADAAYTNPPIAIENE